MAKSEKHSFLWVYFIIGFAVGYIGCNQYCNGGNSLGKINHSEFDTDFGNWLAANHALYVDDFDQAADFISGISDKKSEIVSATRDLVTFLDGGDLSRIRNLKKANSAAFHVINAVKNVRDGKWKVVYGGFKSEQSQALAPFRIWSAVATGNFAKALDFIKKNERANNSWKNFARGVIYAATKNPKTAKKNFQKVPPSFMNLGDYHLVMSFYKKHGFGKDAEKLRQQWIESPGGMYMANLDLGEDWKNYDSYQKMLAAGLIQNVSHGGEDGMSDSGMLLLRSAASLGAEEDSVNYYLGGYFYAMGSDNYKRYWDKAAANQIYRPFIEMKIAEITGNSEKSDRTMKRILGEFPLFMPAMQTLWRQNVQNGRENDVMRMLDRALRHDGLPDAGKAYLLKMRAHALYIFGELDYAAEDLEHAIELAPLDAGVMGLQARIWALQKKNLDEAYRYTISLVKAFPMNMENWGVLAMVVRAKEGDAAALEVLERVGRVAEECSELFLHLGDLRMKAGLRIGARAAYKKAIALSDDGLVIKSDVERKLRRLE